jgi:hypothetical protein
VMVDVIFSEGRVVCSFPYLHIMVFFVSFWWLVTFSTLLLCAMLAEERNSFFFSVSLSFLPPQEPVSFHILTVCRLAVYFLNSDEECRSVFLTVFIFLLFLHFRSDTFKNNSTYRICKFLFLILGEVYLYCLQQGDVE